ncbi:MAG TPA: hypothetical protein VNE61_16345 [Ktedonobacteraceae bacterium]|nr:hypothetical protein [Ktedonobacteraceae bacterium]
MIDDPERQAMPPEKLLLPAPPETRVPPTPTVAHPAQVKPEWLIRRQTPPPPRSPFARVRYLWRKDPAYKVLLVAVMVVLLAGLLLATLATSAFFRAGNPFQSSAYTQAPTGATPAGTVDLRPTFPTPGGGQGSTSSSQPPAQNTPAPQPTTPPQSSGLTVQFTNIPTRVQSGSTVLVGVSTNEPGATVWLTISYGSPPFRGYAGPRVTGSNGFATIPWSINIFAGGRHSTAVVTAFARNQQGQQTHSQPVQVQISGTGGG